MRSKTIIRFTEEELQNILNDPNSQVHLKENVDYQAALTPVCLQDPEAAIYAMLDRTLMAYIPKYKGILLSYKNVRTRKNTGHIDGDNCHIFIDLIIDVYIFAPTVGCILKGIVSKKSPDGVGCLVHKGFNVAIPRPWDGSNDEWSGNEVNISQEVTLQVEVLNFSGRLPYIRGKFITDIVTTKQKKKSKTKLKDESLIGSENAAKVGDTFDLQEKNDNASSDTGGMKNTSKKKKKKSKDKSESEHDEILENSDKNQHLCRQKKMLHSDFEESQIVQALSTKTNSVKGRKKCKKESKCKSSEDGETPPIEVNSKYVIDIAQPNSSNSSGILLNGADLTSGNFTCDNEHVHSSKKHKKNKEYVSDSRDLLEENDSKFSLKQLPLLKSKSQHDEEDSHLSQKHSQPQHTSSKYLDNVKKIKDLRTEEESFLEEHNSNHLVNALVHFEKRSLRPTMDEDKIDCNYHQSENEKKKKRRPPSEDSNVQRHESKDLINYLLATKMKTIVDNEGDMSEFMIVPQKLNRKRKRSEQMCSENEREPEVVVKKPRKSSEGKHGTSKTVSSSKHHMKSKNKSHDDVLLGTTNTHDKKSKLRTSSISSLSEEF